MSQTFRILIKLVLSAAVITAASELARRSPRLGALIIALPLSSLLAIYWLHFDGVAQNQIATFCTEILKVVVPSLLFFVVLPLLLKQGWNFHLAVGASLLAMLVGYGIWIYFAK